MAATEKVPDTTKFVRESSRIGINVIALVTSRFLCLVLSFVQAGVILRALGSEHFGPFAFALGFSALFTVFATLGIHRLLVRDISRDARIAWTYVWTALVVVLVLSTVVWCAVAGTIYTIDQSPEVRAAVMLAALSLVNLWALQRPFEALLTAKERLVVVACIYFVTSVLKLASVYFVVKRMPSAAAAHGAIALANCAGFAICVGCTVMVAGFERPRVRFALAMEQIRECFPFMVAAICSQIYFKSDVSILKFMRGDAPVAVYGAALRITEPIMMVAGLWGTAVFPALCRFSVHVPENYTRLKRTSARLALLLSLPMAVGIAVLAAPIMKLLAGAARFGEFAQSVVVLRIVCVAIPLFYLNGIGQEFFYASHRNWFIVRTYALAAVVSVVGNLLVIPRFGVLGVACTVIAANLAVTLVFICGMRAEFGAMGMVRLVAKTLAACAIMGGVVHTLADISVVAAVCIGGLVYALLQFMLGTLDADEQQFAGRMLRAPLYPFSKSRMRK